MNSKIINPSQYKKISKDKKEKRRLKIEKSIKSGKILTKENINSKENSYSKKSRIVIAIFSIFTMFLVSFSSAVIFEIEQNKAVVTVATNEEIDNIYRDFEFKIGALDMNLERNIIVNELSKVSYNSILTYDENYKISYDLAEAVNKLDNLTYSVKFKEQGVNELVKKQIEAVVNNDKNIYYKEFSKISSVEIIDKYTMNIKLKEANEYFIYYLDFPIEIKNDKLNNLYDMNVDKASLKISMNATKNTKNNLLNKIVVTNYLRNVDIINDFKNKNLDMFITSNEDNMKMLSRYDYNLKKYRDGETYFILGSQSSELFKMPEVRKAIAYTLDKNQIAKKISTSFAEIIDLPYIYSNNSYKYDIYAAENILIANSWSKQGGAVYTKKDNGKIYSLELKLVVNKEDEIKVIIADSIKEMLENFGIRVNLKKLTNEELNKVLEEKSYDIAIAKVALSSTPDIRFLYDYLKINDNIKNAIKNIESSTNAEEIEININALKTAISEEVACIGVIAKNANVVLQKDIAGIEEISYMNIFKNISNIR